LAIVFIGANTAEHVEFSSSDEESKSHYNTPKVLLLKITEEN
jgi:hypothetical protein